jgi:hypothetical protein
MSTLRFFALSLLGLLGAQCRPIEEPAIVLSADKTTFDGRSDHAIIRVQAYDKGGVAGAGQVSMLSAVGSFVEGNELTLINGAATATFVCRPDDESGCNGNVQIGATWKGLNEVLQIRVTPSIPKTPVIWKVVPTLSLTTVRGAITAPNGVVWAVGTGGSILQLKNGLWSTVASPVTTDLNAVAILQNGDPIIVGAAGVLLGWNAGVFQVLQTQAMDDFTAVWGASSSDLTLGTSIGQIRHFNGTAVEDVFALGSPVLSFVAGTGTDVVAIGTSTIAKFNGTAWTMETAPATTIFKTGLMGPDGLWLAGARTDSRQGVVSVGPGPDWKSSIVSSEPVEALTWFAGSDERFAVTQSRVYRKTGGSVWEAVEAPMGGTRAVSRFAGDIVILGPPGISLIRTR